MVCVDSSVWIAYFAGAPGPDVDFLQRLLDDGTAVLAAPVLSELLSDPRIPSDLESFLLDTPVLPLLDGYWERAGRLRRRMLAAHRKAKLADVLIAQSCIDHRLMLLTRDADFKVFVQYSELAVWQPNSG
jgi:predicted nucleic acid-binding protein